jgi:hypothetical protein
VAIYHVKFIFNDGQYEIFDKTHDRTMILPVVEPVTEENFEDVFANVLAAGRLRGLFKDGDEVHCITFPAGSRRVVPQGTA